MKVLLVDDEHEFLDLMTKRLGRRGVEVTAVADGQAALDFLAEERVDVVVLDVLMPGMDGMEALKRIKALDPGVEVLMLTGHANMEAAVQGMELGAFDYLMKPVALNELLFKLQDAYDKGRLDHRRGA